MDENLKFLSSLAGLWIGLNYQHQKNQFPDDKKIIGQQHQNGPKQGPKQDFLDPLFLLVK